MRSYKKGVDRNQGNLFPVRLEEYVDASNPVRAIEAYVETLNLSRLGYGKTGNSRSAAGQPPYPPSALLKLYLYGYIHRLRSSRLLEKECSRNIEVMWLLEGLKPCYKTIADFRKDNASALRQTHKEFILLCKELELLGGERIAVDGSFFRGSVSKQSFITDKGLSQAIVRLETDIAQWLAALDAQDREITPLAFTDSADLPQKLAHLKALQTAKAAKEAQLQHLNHLGKTQHSDIDSDARLLNKGTQKLAGYNVQIATDARHKLIVTDDVVSEPNDLQQLAPMATSAQAVLGSKTLEVLADAGYYSADHLARCLNAQITPYVSIPPQGKRQENNQRFTKAHFQYDTPGDTYQCPVGHVLRRQGAPRAQCGSLTQRYIASETACLKCAMHRACLPEKSRRREIWRHEHEAVMEAHKQRMQIHGALMRERAALVEHPFGTLKRRAGWDHFLVRGLQKVRGEWSLMAWAYNFTRVLNIMGLDAFKRRCAERLVAFLAAYIRSVTIAVTATKNRLSDDGLGCIRQRWRYGQRMTVVASQR